MSAKCTITISFAITIVLAAGSAGAAEYLVAYTLSAGDLVEVPLNGLPYTVVGPTGYQPGRLAFSPAGVLYAIDPHVDMLLTIDPATGAATPVGPLGIDVDDDIGPISAGMAFDGNGELWMSSGLDLYTVDTASGATQFQVTMWDEADLLYGISSITFVNDVLYVEYDWLHRVDLETGLATPAENFYLSQGWVEGMATKGGRLFGRLSRWRDVGPTLYTWHSVSSFDFSSQNWIPTLFQSFCWVGQCAFPDGLHGLAVTTRQTPAIPVLGPFGTLVLVVSIGVLGFLFAAGIRANRW